MKLKVQFQIVLLCVFQCCGFQPKALYFLGGTFLKIFSFSPPKIGNGGNIMFINAMLPLNDLLRRTAM